MNTLGERLRATRLQRRVGQKELAGEVGVSQSLVSRWEKGKADPSVVQAIQLALVLGIPALYLIEGKATLQDRSQQELLVEVRYYGMTDLMGPEKAVWAVRGVEEVMAVALQLADPRIIDRLPVLFFRQRDFSGHLAWGYAKARGVEQRFGWIWDVSRTLMVDGMGWETPALMSYSPPFGPQSYDWDHMGFPPPDRVNLQPAWKRWKIEYDQTLQGMQKVVEPLLKTVYDVSIGVP